MKALVFSSKAATNLPPAPDFLPGLNNLSLLDVPVPDLPNNNWVVVKSRISGICGSDLGFLRWKPMQAAEPYFELPMTPGHELFGEVEAVGKAVKGLNIGQRVTIDPTLGCRERAIRKMCKQCRKGNPGICEHIAEGLLRPGLLIGICPDTGGGWSEYFVAHGRRLTPLPDSIGDDEASLIEPFAVCLRAVLNNRPRRNELVVVLGAGTIGLMNVAALKAVEPSCVVACVAKYSFQADLARDLGADHIVCAQEDDVMERIAQLAESKVYQLTSGGAVLAGGVRLVFDTITNSVTLNQGLRMARGKGRVIVLGLAAMPEGVDWTPTWMKEVSIVGSLTYGTETFQGRRQDTFVRAVELLGERKANLQPIRPRKYPLEQYRQALTDAANKKSSNAVKVSFTP